MGLVYVVEMEDTGWFKVGKTSNADPRERVSSLQTANPLDLHIRAVVLTNYHSWLEQSLHLKLKKFKNRGEWFKVNYTDLVSIIREIISYFEEGTIIEASGMTDYYLGLNSSNAAIPDDTDTSADNIYAETTYGITSTELNTLEKEQLLIWGRAGVSRREMARRIYSNRGGKSDYDGTGTIYTKVKTFLDSAIL